MDKTENKIGQDFSVWGLMKFAMPAFFMNVFSQLFRSLDDGLFISRFAGEKALASLNLLNPVAGVLLSIMHLFSLGAANISAKLMGQGKQQEAKRVFTRVVVSGLISTVLFTVLVNVFSRPLLLFLGADDSTISYATTQIRIVYMIAPISLVDQIFSCYYSTAGKPKMGLICSLTNGVVNIGLDYILVVLLKMGVLGASIATAAGDIAVFIIGICFYLNRKNEIHFVTPEGKIVKTTLDSAKYALPQAVNSLSFSVTALLSNKIILSIIGSQGVAANAVVSDIRKILVSGLVGFAACIGPVLSFNYGSQNVKRLKKIVGEAVQIWLVVSVTLTFIGLLLRKPLISIFMSEDSTIEFFNMSYRALTVELYGTAFVSGCIMMSRGFIALSKPKLATILSAFRNLIIKTIVFIALPYLLGEKGIWLSYTVGEGLSFAFGLLLIRLNKDTLLKMSG